MSRATNSVCNLQLSLKWPLSTSPITAIKDCQLYTKGKMVSIALTYLLPKELRGDRSGASFQTQTHALSSCG